MTISTNAASAPRTVVTFASTSDALAMESCARENAIPGRLAPAPSQIAAGCGFAWIAPTPEKAAVMSAITAHGLACEGIFDLDDVPEKTLRPQTPPVPVVPGEAAPACPVAGGDVRIGIDIGSTAAKVAVLVGDEVAFTLAMPTGFSSVDAADRLRDALAATGYDVGAHPVVATGYGRVSVPFAAKTVTEITCHGRGAAFLFGEDGVIVDVGGQDTKVIQLAAGRVKKFVMNDKCAAGTGRFLEVMADRMGISQAKMAQLAREGTPAPISSMCTVFAESEVIGLIGRGEAIGDIASGVIESVVKRVATLAAQVPGGPHFLTGGLCDNDYVVARLAAALGDPVRTCPQARFAGAIGAALSC